MIALIIFFLIAGIITWFIALMDDVLNMITDEEEDKNSKIMIWIITVILIFVLIMFFTITWLQINQVINS